MWVYYFLMNNEQIKVTTKKWPWFSNFTTLQVYIPPSPFFLLMRLKDQNFSRTSSKLPEGILLLAYKIDTNNFLDNSCMMFLLGFFFYQFVFVFMFTICSCKWKTSTRTTEITPSFAASMPRRSTCTWGPWRTKWRYLLATWTEKVRSRVACVTSWSIGWCKSILGSISYKRPSSSQYSSSTDSWL